jgi:hypothetical protein
MKKGICLAKLAAIFCAVFRHSHLVTNCLGYKYCARCGAQLGQTCRCASCRESFDTLTWLDRFICAKPEWPKP